MRSFISWILLNSAFDVVFNENDELFKLSIPDVDKDDGKLLITLFNFFKYNFLTVAHGNLLEQNFFRA